MTSLTALVLSVMWTACLLGGFFCARYALKEHRVKKVIGFDSCRFCGNGTLLLVDKAKQRFFCTECRSEGLIV